MSSLSKDETQAQAEIDLEEMFFVVEAEVEEVSRQPVCLDDEIEQKYLQDVTELLLYLLLPPEQFRDKLVRSFLLEIIATSVFLPTIKMVCDPDYVNQNISWMVFYLFFLFLFFFNFHIFFHIVCIDVLFLVMFNTLTVGRFFVFTSKLICVKLILFLIRIF